ncbi:hypothetical protein [Candidatus Poriferisodalis sp.]|uniref:hypothetical protein n=1 Tax=Candidatus Poriferisodalis sp. TaxID=3101277 RepID=UPI003B019F0C
MSALDVWTGLSAALQLSPIMCVECCAPVSDDPAPPDLGRSSRLLHAGEWRSVGLMYELHGQGALSRVDIVTVCTADLGPTQQVELARADRMLRHDLQRIMPEHTRVASHRVWVPRYGDDGLVPGEDFASPEANSALVVLPSDRQFERAAAMPVGDGEPDDASHDEVYAWHVAVEVASLAGFWSTMDGAPVEFVPSAVSGVGRPLVRLVRSMCRAARIHTPSPEQSLDGTGLLPLTPGQLPAPDPAYTVRAAAPYIYPRDYRVPADMSDGSLHEANAVDGAAATPYSEVRSLMPLSQTASARRLASETISSALERDQDVAQAASRLDDYVKQTAQVAPWTAPLVEGTDDFDDTSSMSSSVRQKAKQLLDAGRPPVSIERVPTDGWDALLDGVFGMADAASGADHVRDEIAGARYVVVDPDALAPDADELTQAVAMLDPNAHLSSAADGASINTAAPDSGSGDAQGDDPPDNDESDDESGTLPLADAGDSGWQDEPTLLAEVTRQFDEEIERSERDVEHHIGLLQQHIDPKTRPEPGVTSFVAYALLASVLIGAGSLLTLTELREVFTPDRLSEDQRITSFLLLSLAATVPPMLRLTPSRSWSAQIRLTLVAAVYAGTAAVTVVAASAIEQSWLSRPGQWMPAITVVSSVMALAIAAWVRGFAGDSGFAGDRGLLGPLAALVGDRVAGAVPFVYAFVIAVAGLNFDATAPTIFEDRSWRLLTVLLTVAVAVAVATGGLVLLIRRRDRQQVSAWRDRIDELVDECEAAAARTAALETLKAHWLTTAAVVARLLHRPFGSHHAAAPPQDPTPAVRKLLMFDLQLTDETRDAFLGELLPELAPSGWLREQYRRMSSRFVSSERTRFGIGADGFMPPPEHDAYPMPLDSVLRGEGTGPRWRFAQRVYSGEFDPLLHETALDALNRAMAKTFMSDRITVSLGRSGTGRQTLPQLLGELLPAGEKRLPSGTLPPSIEAPPEYESRVWWPEAVAMPEGEAPAEHRCRDLRAHGTVLFHAVRVDISEPVDLKRLTSLARLDAAADDDAASSDSAEAPAALLM